MVTSKSSDLKRAQTLFIDLDGTLAEFKYVESMDMLYKKGYFLNLKPIQNVLDGIKCFIKKYPEVEVYILSAYLADSIYAMQEKTMWLKKHIPEIREEHHLFVKCGQSKSIVPLKGENAFLLDDHSQNLIDWEKAGFRGIKLLNGINGKGCKWHGARISSDIPPERFADKLYDLTSWQRGGSKK